MGDLGLFGLTIPEDFGGSSADLTTLCLHARRHCRVPHRRHVGRGVGVDHLHPVVPHAVSRCQPRLELGLGHWFLGSLLPQNASIVPQASG
jgi:hypothetical protein